MSFCTLLAHKIVAKNLAISTIKLVLKNARWHIVFSMCRCECQNYFYKQKLSLTYLRKTLINQG